MGLPEMKPTAVQQAATLNRNHLMRRWIANKLAGLARRIYPQSPEVIAFWSDRMMEQIIYGQSTIKISSVPMDDMIVHMGDGKVWGMKDGEWNPK